MKCLLNKGFQLVSETEMVMVEGGSPTPPGVEPGPAPDDAGQYPKQPKKGGVKIPAAPPLNNNN